MSSARSHSCLRVEEWKDRVFSERYTIDNIVCEPATEILGNITSKYASVQRFAEDVHAIYNDLLNEYSGYFSE